MQKRRLEHLTERLLRGGVRPRHVRRIVDELRGHYDDVLRDEEAKGLSGEEAQNAAWARLGNDDDIVQSALARPELRSIIARHPGLIFGAGSFVAWVALIFMMAFFLIILRDHTHLLLREPAQTISIVDFGSFIILRILPVVLGAAIVDLALRQRIRSRWVLTGALIFALITGMSSFHVKLSPARAAVKSMDVRISPQNLNLARGATMFVLMLVPYVLRGRRDEEFE